MARQQTSSYCFTRRLSVWSAGRASREGESKMSSQATAAPTHPNGRLALASLAALGVVFGDIGTSPLYTPKTVLDYTGPHPDPAAVLGAVSLILWTLVLIVTVKYVNFAMRVDNDGEGGVIALMTLLGVKKHQRPIIVAVGLFGAALIYGDGAITPAIYVGAVNWLLMIVTLGLTIGFGKSDNLAAAYGIAVSATMLMTSVLLFIAMREIWNWPVWAAGAVAALFIIVDFSFFAANMAKVLDGGWVPLLLASVVYGVMWIWHRGAAAVHDRIVADRTPLIAMAEQLHSGKIARVPGSAVFLTRAKDQTPPVMVWHVRQNRALHEYVLALTLTVLSVPWTDPEERLSVVRVDDKFWRAEARRGFMEHPDIPEILAECKAKGAEIDLDDVTFYVGSETIVPREDGKGMPRWQEALFAALGRNAARISDYLDLPCDKVVEIGREIEI